MALYWRLNVWRRSRTEVFRTLERSIIKRDDTLCKSRFEYDECSKVLFSHHRKLTELFSRRLFLSKTQSIDFHAVSECGVYMEIKRIQVREYTSVKVL